jgi:CheY-like chemotaxis protein/MinD-like ATPase involved in chromosome partitioning or flagellar assembly
MNQKILAIDDHPETLNAIVDALRPHGYQVLSSLSPFDGLAIARDEHPDLILLDVNMPGMSGTEFARLLRADNRLCHIPVIMFTAEELPQQKLAGFDSGADDYLLKPTNPEILIERIQMILGAQPRPGAGPLPQTLVNGSPSVSLRKVIALVGAHGGAGTTTLALNLALAIAGWDVPTTLIDYDLQQGHLALYLNCKLSGQSINQYAQQPAAAPNVHKNLINHSQNHNLQLLLARPNLLHDAPLPDAEHSIMLLHTLGQVDGCVIVDMGRGVNATGQPVIERADEVYVCVQPNRVSLASARFLLHKLKDRMLVEAHLGVIGFQIGGSTLRPDAIEQYLKRPLLGMVTVQPKELAISVNQKLPFIDMEQSPAGETFRQMAHEIITR